MKNKKKNKFLFEFDVTKFGGFKNVYGGVEIIPPVLVNLCFKQKVMVMEMIARKLGIYNMTFKQSNGFVPEDCQQEDYVYGISLKNYNFDEDDSINYDDID